MLNEVGMKIKLVKSKDNFCLMGEAGAKLQVTHASLFVRKSETITIRVFGTCQGDGE